MLLILGQLHAFQFSDFRPFHTYIYNLPYDMINLALKIFLQIHMTTKSTIAILELNNSKVSEASINQRNLSN